MFGVDVDTVLLICDAVSAVECLPTF